MSILAARRVILGILAVQFTGLSFGLAYSIKHEDYVGAFYFLMFVIWAGVMLVATACGRIFNPEMGR